MYYGAWVGLVVVGAIIAIVFGFIGAFNIYDRLYRHGAASLGAGLLGVVMLIVGVVCGEAREERVQREAIEEAIERLAVRDDGLTDFSLAPDICRCRGGYPTNWFLSALRERGYVMKDESKPAEWWLFRNLFDDRSDETLKAIKRARALGE